jgi:hypothetical protein
MSKIKLIDPKVIKDNKDGTSTLDLDDFEHIGLMLELIRELNGWGLDQAIEQITKTHKKEVMHKSAIPRLENGQGNIATLVNILKGYQLKVTITFKNNYDEEQ